jgi:mannose-1-phosphate guanylyltransferase/phosphomannomutase
MKAIIMAGGQGTRLRPLTCSVPKPLAKLCGRPVVCYILDLLDKHGFTEAVFTLGYKGEQIEDYFETGQYKGLTLRFSREDTPLGTAGCVKHAVGTACKTSASPVSDEPFLVISGDALCDFDLSAVMRLHKTDNAQATIITKQVDDPREYGLVISETERDGESAKVVGFSEKPSYLGCIGDKANTGVYILSPQVMSLIPDEGQSDFARDIFPQMLRKGMSLRSCEEQGYWCDIGDFATYSQSQFDMIAGLVGGISLGHSIVGDNYIGREVSVGENTDITSSIIGDNVTIGNNVKLRNSVIGDNVYVSDGATVNDAIICAGSKLMHSASVYEGSVVGEGCLIGREAIVSNGAKIWNGRTIPPGASITRNVKYGGGEDRSRVEFSESGITGETNADITPELCTALGAALACVSARIAVSCEDNNASKAMKLAVMSGGSAAGGEVFDAGTVGLPQLICAAQALDCGVTARVKCGIFAQIEVLSDSGLPLTRLEERRFEAALNRGEYKNAERNSFGSVRAVGGFMNIYCSMLSRFARFTSGYSVKLNCGSPEIVPVFDSICTKSGEMLVVTLTDGGTKAEFYTGNGGKVSYEQLTLLAVVSQMQNGFDVALPQDFAGCADFLAESCGKRIHRFFRCSNDSGDGYARELAAKQPFLRDGAVLALNVLEYLAQSNQSIESAVKALPQFASEWREVQINCPPQRIITMLCANRGNSAAGAGEGVLLGDAGRNVRVRSARRGKSLFLLAESLSSETAAELCDSAEKLIQKLMEENA